MNDGVIKWKLFPQHWSFVMGICCSLTHSSPKRPVIRNFGVYLLLAWISKLRCFVRWFVSVWLASSVSHNNDAMFLHTQSKTEKPSHGIKTITLTSKWARLRLKSPASWLFAQPFIQAQIKENIKAPCHWPLCGEFTGTGEFPHKWPVTRKMFPFDDITMTPLTKGQWCGALVFPLLLVWTGCWMNKRIIGVLERYKLGVVIILIAVLKLTTIIVNTVVQVGGRRMQSKTQRRIQHIQTFQKSVSLTLDGKGL